MNELNNLELQFLIDISKDKRKEYRYNGDNISTDNTTTHSVDIYFIIQKLENLIK